MLNFQADTPSEMRAELVRHLEHLIDTCPIRARVLTVDVLECLRNDLEASKIEPKPRLSYANCVICGTTIRHTERYCAPCDPRE